MKWKNTGFGWNPFIFKEFRRVKLNILYSENEDSGVFFACKMLKYHSNGSIFSSNHEQSFLAFLLIKKYCIMQELNHIFDQKHPKSKYRRFAKNVTAPYKKKRWGTGNKYPFIECYYYFSEIDIHRLKKNIDSLNYVVF